MQVSCPEAHTATEPEDREPERPGKGSGYFPQGSLERKGHIVHFLSGSHYWVSCGNLETTGEGSCPQHRVGPREVRRGQVGRPPVAPHWSKLQRDCGVSSGAKSPPHRRGAQRGRKHLVCSSCAQGRERKQGSEGPEAHTGVGRMLPGPTAPST